MCGKHVMVEFCNDTPWAPPYADEWADKCNSNNGMSAVGSVWNTDMVYGKKVSSIRMRYYDAATLGCVNVFKDVECKSYSGYFCHYGEPDEKSYKSQADLFYGHVWDNEANAI